MRSGGRDSTNPDCVMYSLLVAVTGESCRVGGWVMVGTLRGFRAAAAAA